MSLFDLTPAQKWIFSYFAEPYEWYDRLTFQFNVPIDCVRLKKSLCHLVKKYDSLRTCFIKKEGHWKQKILLYEDGIVPEPLFVSTFSELALCRQIRLSQLPLFRLVVVRLSADSYQLTFLFHHLIVDYLSLQIIYKEFCWHYLGIQQTPVFDSKTNAEYALQINKAKKQNMLAFWQKNISSKEYSKASLEREAKWLHHKFGWEAIEPWVRFGKKQFNVASLHVLLAAPLYQIVGKILGESTVTISHKLHGREIEGQLFFDTVGNFAVNVPLLCPVNQDFPSLVQQIEIRLRNIPLSGLSYDLISPESLYPDHLCAQIRFNYLGHFRPLQFDSVKIDPFNFARRVVHPHQRLTALVEFFLFFYEKELYLDACYDSSTIHSSFANDLFNEYRKVFYDAENSFNLGSRNSRTLCRNTP